MAQSIRHSTQIYFFSWALQKWIDSKWEILGFYSRFDKALALQDLDDCRREYPSVRFRLIPLVHTA